MRYGHLLIFPASLLAMLGAGCGSSDSSESIFMDAAKNTLPSILGTASAVTVRPSANPVRGLFNTGWQYGNPMYTMYDLLRDFPHTVAEDMSVGVGFSDSNVYKSLWIADKRYNGAKSGCATTAATAIPSPFPFGLTDTYDCKEDFRNNDDGSSSGAAIRTDGTKRYALVARKSGAEGGGTGGTFYSIWQGNVDSATNDVLVHFAMYADLASNDYGNHFYVKGNATTHQFLVKFYTAQETGTYTSLIGYGISKGEGNYYLFKLRDSANATPGNEKYFCFPAAATVTQYQAIDPNAGKLAGDIAAASDWADVCKNSYKTAVDAEKFFWHDTADQTGIPGLSDAPLSTAVFNVGNANAGTLNF